MHQRSGGAPVGTDTIVERCAIAIACSVAQPAVPWQGAEPRQLGDIVVRVER
jgi:hypothetical protein